MTTVPKSKVVSIATVDTCKNAQLANLYTHLLETDDEIVIEPSNRKLMINCVKTCSKFKKYRNSSSIPEVLFCFDGQSNFLCSFAELSNLYFDISLPKKVLSRYLGKELSFDDKKKILYQIHVGEMFHEVAEIPWWALTLPQMIAFTQEKVEGISEEKVRALSYPHTWLATKIKTGEEFKRQFGNPSQFDYATFGFSLGNPLDCSWSCVKTNETKLFNSKIKSLFAKSSVPPQSQNLTKAVCKKSKSSPPIKTTSLVEAPSTAKKPKGVSENSPPNLGKVSRDNPALKLATTSSDSANPGSLNAKEEILIQVSSAEFVSTMCHEKLNSVIESLNLDLPKATTKNIKSLTKSYIESADYQQRLLLTPFQSLIFCFNDNSEFICMFHELSEANHDIVLQQEKHETYLKLSKNKFTFLDLKRIIFHSLLSRENFNIELPWVGLTHAQKQSVTSMHLGKDSVETELLLQEESMLLKTLKLSAQFSHITKRKLENNLMFEFSITDPLQIKVWEVKKSDNLRKYISSLNELFGIKSSAQLDIVKAKENTVSDVKDIISVDPKEKSGNSIVERICSKGKKNSHNKQTLVKGDMGSSESAKETLTSTPKPQKIINDNQLKLDQVATNQPNLLEDEACKTCSKQYGNDTTLECFVCKNKVHYVCYKGTNGKELSQEHFKLIKENKPNLKWFCNKCNAMSIESLTSTLTDKSWVQSEKENSTEDTKKEDGSLFRERYHVSYDKITQASEVQYAAFETLDHVSAIDHTRECPSDTPKRSCNLIGDIGPISLITEADEEKQDELEFNFSKPIGGNSDIMHKIDLLLNQRKEDSKVVSEILRSLKSPDRETDDSYCGRLTSPRPYPHGHGPTYGIPEKPVKTTVKPTRTLVISKDISCSLSKGSGEIKTEFNKLYRDVPIEHCFASKGGSIFIELASEDEAMRVVNSWKTSFFADSNRGPQDGTVCKLLSSIQNSVIVKDVPTEFKEDFIQKCIQENYPGAQVKRFVKAGKIELRTIKIDLTTPEQSEKMIERGLLIHNLSLRAEKYIPRQRVIQCYHCYKFGHVAKFCHQKKPTCPMCAQNHHPEECDHTTQLCCNCASPSHYATSKNCPKFKTVLERIKNSNGISHQYENQNHPKNLGHDF